jgi:putative transposase
VIVDGLVLRVREDNRVRQKSALIAVGVNEEGYREILGLQIGQSETESSWKDFFRWLKRRGLHDVDVIVSDDHSGLKNAAFQVFQDETIWQRCQFHFLKNIRDRSPNKYEDEIHRRVKEALESATKMKARERVHEILNEYEDKAPKAMETLETGFEDAIAVLALPGKYRRRLRKTNSLERLNEEIRRREKVIRIFPNEDSAHRLVGDLLLEQHEELVTGRRYFDMTEYNDWKQKQTTENPADDPEVMVA